MTPKTLTWARDAFKRDVQCFLDDPHGVVEGQDFKCYVDTLQGIAQDLGLDYDAVVQEQGTPYEIERLKKLVDE